MQNYSKEERKMIIDYVLQGKNEQEAMDIDEFFAQVEDEDM